ncbi:MAG: transglycosylase SLT domain-containing protein [Acidobacteriia bacterium]|nr:transglycosylase SLT domain-containing protein [Terriglobia bacterium]
MFVLSLSILRGDPESWAASSPQSESLETLAKQLAATGAPSVAHQLALLSQQSEDPGVAALASFALGYSAYQNGDFRAAAEFFAHPNLKNQIVSDYAILFLARSQHRLKSYAAAITTLENFSSQFQTSRLVTDANLERCQVWIENNESGRCVELLHSLPNLEASPRLMLMLAQALDSGSNWSSEASVLQRVAYEYPLSPEAPQAKDMLQTLRRLHPAAVPMPGAAAVLARAEAFYGQKRFRDSLADYQSLLGSGQKTTQHLSAEERANLELRVGECLLHLGRLREAERAIAKASPVTGEKEAERLYTAAELKRKKSVKSPEEFERAVIQLEERFPSSVWTEAGIFSLGNYFLVHHDRPRATEEFEKLVQRFPKGRNASESLFRVAWSAYLRRDYSAAQTSFKTFVGLYPESNRTGSALYWIGRIAEMSNPQEGAVYLAEVSRAFGENVYAQSARGRLFKLHLTGEAEKLEWALPDLKPKISIEDSAPVEPATSDSLRRADIFRRISLLDLAVKELRSLLDRKRSVEAAKELAGIYLTRQHYGAAMATVRQTFPDYYRASLDQLSPEFWHALFPLPYWSTILAEAQRKGVDPFLVAALIRQESAFDANARSPAKAQGLMQLLPREARRYARKEKLPRWRPKSIYTPEINIRLGVAYLADTLRRFNGRLELALAAYNAGDDRVIAWTQEQSMAGMAEDPMEFIESIPFTETRDYVQILLRNLNYYKKIYSQNGTG